MKKGAERVSRQGWLLLLGAILCNAGANVSMKAGMAGRSAVLDQGVGAVLWTVVSNPWVVLGFALFGAPFVLYSAVLARLELSVAYPIMTGGGFLLILLASVSLLQEPLTLPRVLGMLSIAVGISAVSIQR